LQQKHPDSLEKGFAGYLLSSLYIGLLNVYNTEANVIYVKAINNSGI
jgi:hypothetical protein